MKHKLLAKSQSKDSQKNNRTIAEHTQDLLAAYHTIIDRLDSSEKEKQMIYWLCVTHDLGKANSKFQNRIRQNIAKNEKKTDFFQIESITKERKEIRHNLLSPAFAMKLLQDQNDFSKIDKKIMVKAIMLHHGNFDNYLEISYASIEEAIYGDIGVDLLSIKEKFDFAELENLIFDSLGMKYSFSRENLSYDYISDFHENIGLDLADVEIDNFEDVENKYKQQYIEIKGFLNLIDHIASSQEDRKFDYYLTEKEQAGNDQNLLDFIKKQTGLKDPRFNPLQEDIMQYQGNKLVVTQAFTSAGKTISDDRLVANKKIYLTPNRISAMSFYQDACEKYNRKNVGVLHGTLHLYQDEKEEKFNEISLSKNDIELARNFAQPYILATVDQIAMAVFKHPNYEKTLAVLKGTRVCVDEIHLLSPRMFLAFWLLMDYAMEHLDTKFHLMTATLPIIYQEKLKQLTEFTNQKIELVDDATKKINLRMDVKKEKISSLCEEALDQNQQILIILNSIDDVITLYDKLRKVLPKETQIQCLHSRFKEKELKDLYKRINQQEGTIWITTQVVEIALDIDFPVVISDLSPMDSLVQRMGRNNRKGKLAAGGDFYLLEKAKSSVYPEVLLTETEGLLKKELKKKNSLPLTLKERQTILEMYYEQKKVVDYYESEFKQAEQDIRKIFGLTSRALLTGEIVFFEGDPYRNISDSKKEAAKYFRDADMQVKVYLEEDKADLKGNGITISGRRLYYLRKNSGIEEKGNRVYLLKESVYEYSQEKGLLFKK
ncbi:CRISPR-associated helicase/endonuclease Cas3 [Carnobacterium gallinarum]|uniref:CRISPR-associated helicase/endonuclease Cas3 n=1 Tax=Carnobacterium gallinarum TaxID=2749 RepID=UPI0005564839|nr:CRISPR-associated helicase/endonuclease Cas3 [Carnobacterium gallinarum]